MKARMTDHDCSSAKILVLVVDDDLGMRFLIAEGLAQAGFDVIEADSGRSALKVCQAHRPDVILMDTLLADMDGFAVCAELRKLSWAEHLPVVMMTGLDEESIDLAYDAGATDFITKPINYAVLGYRVRYMLRTSETTAQLARSERRLANAQRVARMGHWDWDAETDVMIWSDEMLWILDQSLRQTTASFESFLSWVPGNDKERVRAWFQRAVVMGEGTDLNHPILCSDGSQRHLRQQVRAVLDADGRVIHLYGTVQDITELHHAEARIHRLAFFDSLTGLPNRESFKERVNQALALNERHDRDGALLFLDLDNFKRINDTLGYSIGDMLLKQIAGAVDSLLQCGDLAMYHAKRSGKNTYRFYNDSMNEVAVMRLTMENQLRKALDRDELSIHYQPQLNLVTEKIAGVEALVRWQNQELGSVAPCKFIPLAEDTGLIVPIGTWILSTACRQAKAWRVSGAPIARVAVNVSVLQFVQPGFPDLVASILADTELEPHALELEVTEGLLLKDAEGAVEILQTLKAIGVQLAIDDFGTGYSSLSYLKQFPIDRLKIDQAFVQGVTDRDSAAIVMAVIAMAKSMGLKVTAEGVETEEQFEFLKAKRCDEVQGLFFSPPVSAAEMSAFLGDNRPVAPEAAPGLYHSKVRQTHNKQHPKA